MNSSKSERVVPSAGPYYVASFAPGQGAVLKMNPNYAGARPRHLSEIDIVLGVGKAQSVSDVEAGRADYAADDVPPETAQRLAARYGAGSEVARRGGQRYFVHSELGVIYLAMNSLWGVHRRMWNFATAADVRPIFGATATATALAIAADIYSANHGVRLQM